MQIKRNKIAQWEEIGYNGFGLVMFGVIWFLIKGNGNQLINRRS
jgi:hypothetical protein